jgi:hypothetical protein
MCFGFLLKNLVGLAEGCSSRREEELGRNRPLPVVPALEPRIFVCPAAAAAAAAATEYSMCIKISDDGKFI